MTNGNGNNNSCGDLLYRIQMYGFVLDEARLYLDTHPDNDLALEYYRKYSELYRRAVAEYESVCGPLTANSASSTDGASWRWIEGGWPWQGSYEEK